VFWVESAAASFGTKLEGLVSAEASEASVLDE
jgi:hypothetical protein